MPARMMGGYGERTSLKRDHEVWSFPLVSGWDRGDAGSSRDCEVQFRRIVIG